MAAAGSVEAEISNWTWEENKKFEIGLVEYPEGTPNRWEKIAATLETKSAADVEQNYVDLMADIEAIEAGLVPLPPYQEMESQQSPKSEKKQRKAGRPWTEEEHRQFLIGLEKYGKGDWKSISRYVVLTRNSTQVASHAQKYFERQDRQERRKKRRSIFDNSIGETSNINKSTDN